MNKSFIKGYPVGANISLLNVIYHKPKKDPETGKYGKDSIDIVYSCNKEESATCGLTSDQIDAELNNVVVSSSNIVVSGKKITISNLTTGTLVVKVKDKIIKT